MTEITIVPVPAHGAEDVVVVPGGPHEGCVYTGTDDGTIWRVSPNGAGGSSVTDVAHTHGRPLGLELDEDGRLLVCDARLGLLQVDPGTGRVETVTDTVAGRRMMFCNNAAIASDGSFWFSDTSTKYGIDRWKDDMVQDTRTGRLIQRTPDGHLCIQLDGLAFANGVALAKDESFVAVAETGARTVKRLWLTGPRAGTHDYLVRDLPGYPDNISRGSDGLIWVTLASPTDPMVERLQKAPKAIRRAVTRIPERLQPAPKRTCRVQAYDDHGVLVHDVDVKTDAYHMVTGVREHDGVVWLGSLHESAVAYVRL